MTPRLKLALSLVAALALAVVVVLVLSEPAASPRDGDYTFEDGDDGMRPDPSGSGGTNPELEGNPDAGTTPGMDVGPDGGGSLVGAREPEGIDLSDPAVRESELRRLFSGPKTDWHRIAKIVGLMTEPIPDDLRDAFLYGLTQGPRPNQTMFAFAALRDESFVEDLLLLLDDPTVVKGARKAVITALWQMPAGNRDDVVRKLEGRFSGDPVKDQQLLYAVNRRGGPEAARALTEYLQSLKNPRQVGHFILRGLDASDPQTAEVLAGAIRSEQSPGVLKALITTASQPGAKALVGPLMSLDRDGLPDDVRQQALDALGRIGNTEAVDYLLRKAEEPGIFGGRAVLALASLNTSERGIADRLAKALDGAANNPHPVKYKKSLLLALGNSRSPNALPAIAKTLDDADREVQMAAVEAMGRMGPRSRAYADKVAGVFDRASEPEQRRVVVALAELGGTEAMAHMRRLLKREDLSGSVRQTLQMGLRTAEKRMDEERKASPGR